MRDLIEALNRAHELDEARSIKEERVKTPDAVIDVNTPFHNAAIAKELGIRAEDILWEIEPDGFSVDPDFKDYIVRDVNGNSYSVRVMGPRPTRRKRPYTEAAFSGGMAGDNSYRGGTIRGRGASTQPSKDNYLGRLKSKNPDLVDIITVKGKDIKPGMITQAGQVKEAEIKKNNRGETKVYIMHTNNYDGFWNVDEDMQVLADPENKSKPFTGNYRALLKMGLQESRDDVGEGLLARDININLDATDLGGKNNNVSVLGGKLPLQSEGILPDLPTPKLSLSLEDLDESVKPDTVVDSIVKMIEKQQFTNRSVSSAGSTITMENADGSKTTYAVRIKQIPEFYLEEELTGTIVKTIDRNNFVKESAIKIIKN